MPRLRVLAGPSPDSLEPITHTVNTYNAFPIVSPGRFEGTVVVHIKGFKGDSDDAKSDDDSYFDRKERKGVTWSIEVKGRFLKDVSSDDVLFGNTFDRKLILPWGSGAALKFMKFIDPTLQHALDSERPWALSPLIVTMPYLSHSNYSSRPQTPSSTTSSLTARTERSSTKSIAPLEEDTSTLPGIDVILATPAKRRAFFSAPERRKKVVFTPNDLITTDFCYGFLSFPRLRLDLPGGISFDLMKYWDGQPVRFVCCERRKDGQPGPGENFWCVVFEVVEDDE